MPRPALCERGRKNEPLFFAHSPPLAVVALRGCGELFGPYGRCGCVACTAFIQRGGGCKSRRCVFCIRGCGVNTPIIHCHRASVIAERRHRFNVTTPSERKARRKRFTDAALLVAVFAAVAVCGVFSLPSQPGAVPNQIAAPGVITPDNAPVKWQKKDFPPVQSKKRKAAK